MSWTRGPLPGSVYSRRRARRVLIDGRWVAVNARRHNRHTVINHGCECEPCTEDARQARAQRWAQELQRRAPHQPELARRAFTTHPLGVTPLGARPTQQGDPSIPGPGRKTA